MKRINTAEFRFYEELNDFLLPVKRKVTFEYKFAGNPSIKDAIEALGVPHTEVDLILVNGKSKKFSYKLKPGDRVSVFPVFESLDITGITQVRNKPLRKPKFILDVHLGKLARYLRLLGFDTLYRNDLQDAEIVRLAKQQHRIILTRDIGLLKNKSITRGYWLRATQPKQQIKEILLRFDLSKKAKPFSRCLECNGKIKLISKQLAEKILPMKTHKYYKKFYRCNTCKRIYWEGSHYKKLQILVIESLKV
jgi:uncharacterized protein with PIN domain